MYSDSLELKMVADSPVTRVEIQLFTFKQLIKHSKVPYMQIYSDKLMHI